MPHKHFFPPYFLNLDSKLRETEITGKGSRTFSKTKIVSSGSQQKVRSWKSVRLQGMNNPGCCFGLIGGCFARCLRTTLVAGGVCALCIFSLKVVQGGTTPVFGGQMGLQCLLLLRGTAGIGAARCSGCPVCCQLIQGDGFRTHSNTVTLLNGFDSLVDVAPI